MEGDKAGRLVLICSLHMCAYRWVYLYTHVHTQPCTTLHTRSIFHKWCFTFKSCVFYAGLAAIVKWRARSPLPPAFLKPIRKNTVCQELRTAGGDHPLRADTCWLGCLLRQMSSLHSCAPEERRDSQPVFLLIVTVTFAINTASAARQSRKQPVLTQVVDSPRPVHHMHP